MPAVDSLPWLIHSIKVSQAPYYENKDFLNKEIRKFFLYFIDQQTGLVKPNLHVSSMKDFAVRKSSCYDNSMVALLAKHLATLKLDNPFSKYAYSSLIKRHFWNGKYFYDDLAKNNYVAGDANLFPFLLGIIENEQMLDSAIEQIEIAELDQPLPLKYTQDRRSVKFIPQEIFLRNYESSAIWMHMGPLYVRLLKEVDADKARQHAASYKALIEKYRNFLEVLDEKGEPFSTPFYYCDSGMLWAANFLTL
jgi:hypothetical protein